MARLEGLKKRVPGLAEVRGPVRIPHGTPTLERWRSLQLVWFRPFDIEALMACQRRSQRPRA